MSNLVKIEVEFDIDELNETITKSLDLKEDREVFEQLASIARVKKVLADAEDKLISIETHVKGLIKNKASALYGSDWTAIAGNGYKILRMQSGAVYTIGNKADKQFVVTKQAPNSKAIEDYIKENAKLPKGIDYNPDRSESIRITVNADN